ncbi:MAG TPA: hypothetical protein VFQ61_16675 [Polyangiaceae bacterium]|nr:hypothetical protein [Polyangiaceae bacterium]
MRSPVNYAVLAFALATSISGLSRAETLQAPIGGKWISLGPARVACEQPGGWSVDPSGHQLRPPAQAEAIGKSVELKIAADASGCAASSNTIRLVATGPWPQLDSNTVVLLPDQNAIEARGRRLQGVGVAWRTESAAGLDVCQPKLEANAERCVWTIGRGVSADPSAGQLSWVPLGGRAGPDVSTFDSDGVRADAATFALVPQQVSLTALLPPDAVIDLSSGRGQVPLLHPEVIRSVECAPARCELGGGKLWVRGLGSDVSAVEVRFGLAPKVGLAKKEGLDSKPHAHLNVLHCPMTVPSGPPLRDVDGARLVVRLDEHCARNLNALTFEVDDRPVRVLQSHSDARETFVLLDVGRLDRDAIAIRARPKQGDDDDVVALTRVDTMKPPRNRSSLEIPGHKNLDFIPNNRPARVHVAPVGAPGRLAVVPVEGVYHVPSDAPDQIVGDPDAAGLVTLRFAYRVETLPEEFRNVDLAVMDDVLQRSVHEANLPVPLGGSVFGPNPLVELVCGPTLHGKRVQPGETERLPFTSRDDCRLVFHRERMPRDYGSQKLTLNIEVVNPDGAVRPDGRVAQTLTLRPGRVPVYAWIHGVQNEFDRVIVRLSHAADEAHYIGASEIDTGSPAVKWTVVFGRGRARLYATTAIPTGLYRFGDPAHSGLLSLNFGVVSRLTWLNEDGREGFLGLETGIMAIGLGNDRSANGESLTQIGAVGGLGVAVPIANRSAPTQASINLHGWVEVDISHTEGNRFAFILGPSVSIGNVGANL